MICVWETLICIFSRAKQHQLSEESRTHTHTTHPPACRPGIAKLSLTNKQTKTTQNKQNNWVCHQGGRQPHLFHFSNLEYRLCFFRL